MSKDPKKVLEQGHIDAVARAGLAKVKSAKALGLKFAWCTQAAAKKLL